MRKTKKGYFGVVAKARKNKININRSGRFSYKGYRKLRFKQARVWKGLRTKRAFKLNKNH